MLPVKLWPRGQAQIGSMAVGPFVTPASEGGRCKPHKALSDKKRLKILRVFTPWTHIQGRQGPS